MKTSFHIRIISPQGLEASLERSESGLTVWGPVKIVPDPSDYFRVELQHDLPSTVVAAILARFLAHHGIRRVELFDHAIDVEEGTLAAVLRSQSRLASAVQSL